MTGYGGPVLLDMSAWARVLLDRVEAGDRARFEEAVRADEILTCEPFLLEALYSARDGGEYGRLEERLGALPGVAGGPSPLPLALDTQAELARSRSVSHRVKPVDLLLAAIAHEHALGILHYDRDYDTISEHTRLRVRSVWIARRGSLA
ncbi:MAG: PIN domain-containing protein [Thermoleophilaceae bacterium]|jgi:predicted nucleic acid-binding protein|nr:PIN domain-containing protein [Thermoleophilaceae bacterium]